jgi:type II secretory pathway component GspD/PulD (secretin)
MRHQCITSCATLALLLAVDSSPAQDGRPPAQPPTPATVVPGVIPVEPGANGATAGRRALNGDKVILAFNDISVEDTIPFIMQATGKVVMPINITTLRAKKITLVNTQPIDRMEALDRLFEAFLLNDVGVIEDTDRVIIALLSEMPRRDPPVVGPDEDVSQRTDRGTMIQKIFAVKNVEAQALADQIAEPLPDHATITVDANSNSIIVRGHVELCQRLGKLIRELDRTHVKIKTQTFRLAHADANEVAQNIIDLFEQANAAGGAQRTAAPARGMSAAQRQRARAAAAQGQQAQPRPVAEGEGGLPSAVELRTTVNVQQNTVTVSGDPAAVDEIERLILTEWDLPRPESTKKVYHLQYTDPLKMRDMLQEMLAGGGSGISRSRGARAGGAAGGAAAQRADVSEVMGGIYQIQAYPDSNSLVVISKTKEAFGFLDSLIAELDRPLSPGTPLVVSLKHANAEEVADQVNAIFAPPGARVDIARQQRGLEGFDFSGPTSGGASGGGGGAATGGASGREGGTTGGASGTMTFPWQQARTDEDQTPESALIGKVRVVPIHRQNAVMILAAPEYRDAMRDFVAHLDKPGRQVLIAAVIAEVELTDQLALGVRFSDLPIPTSAIDNRWGIQSEFEGTANNVMGSLFDVSTLSINSNLNVVLQALAANTKLRVLQEPSVFTSDNQEASFFQGQDVPILQSTTTSPENTVQSNAIEYQSVGIGLNVRPRITPAGDVDLEINLEISNINAAASAAVGGSSINSPTFDRRETTTEVIVKDGQTVVISGILKDTESQVRRKVPFLGDIPFVGELFKSYDNQNTRTELLAFITPLVVDNPNENDTNYNEIARERLLEISKPLKEQTHPTAEETVRNRLLLERYKKAHGPEEPADPAPGSG